MYIYIDLPKLQVAISTSPQDPLLGQPFNITCSVMFTYGLINTPNITWSKSDSISNIDDLYMTEKTSLYEPVLNLTLIADELELNYRGRYVCTAFYNFTDSTFDFDSVTESYSIYLPGKWIILKLIIIIN